MIQNDHSLKGTTGPISAEGTLVANEGSIMQHDYSLKGATTVTAGLTSIEGILADESNIVQNCEGNIS